MALTEQQRARRETNRRAAQQRRIKLGLGRGFALTTFDLTGRTPTFILDALPAELAHIVLDFLPCEALARLALTNREWAAHVAPMIAEVVTKFRATQERIAAATTFNELESLETMVRAHPRMRLRVPDLKHTHDNPTAYDASGWPESIKAYEFRVNDFRAPVGSLLLPDGEPVFKARDHRPHPTYKGHYWDYPLNSADERLVAARHLFRHFLEPTPSFIGWKDPELYEKLWVAATVRLAPKQFVELCAQTLDETDGVDRSGQQPYIFQSVVGTTAARHAGASLLRRGEWTPALLRQLAEMLIGDYSDYDYHSAVGLLSTKDMINVFEDVVSAEVIKEFMVQLHPPGEADTQYFWFHQISDSDCVNETGPRFHPSETHPHRGPGRTMEAHLQELVAHALPLGAAALTRLVKVAVAEVEDYYYLDDDDDDQYGDGHYDEDRHGYEVMAEFVDQWARQSGFLERDDLEEIIEMLDWLPEWLKKLLARKSLGWFEEIATSGKADAAWRLDVVMRICSALRREQPREHRRLGEWVR